jgi:ribosome-associated translation inhibitor RaiA
MRLEIRRRGVKVTEELRAYLKERLRLALSRFGRHMALVQVYLRDVNGPRGGLGKKCRIVVGLRRGGRVVVTGTGTELSAAITGTASRAGFAVRRHVKRRLARRRPPRRPVRRVSLVTVGELVGPSSEREELGGRQKEGWAMR